MFREEISIRRATTIDDYRACQDAQRQAWGIVDDTYIVPIATMVGAQHHGGLVLGAFLGDGTAVGLSFAFLGRINGSLCLYSQLTGVVPTYQDQGLGHELKLAQRRIAFEEGVPLVAWAFDPLQAGNARFNLNKLGATANRYVVDMYGPRTDPLNRDTHTDRLIALWTTDHLEQRHDESSKYDFDSSLRIIDPDIPDFDSLPRTKPLRLLLEIPNDIKALRTEHPKMADRWRLAVRNAFVEAFELGYVATGIHRERLDDHDRYYYVLDRNVLQDD